MNRKSFSNKQRNSFLRDAATGDFIKCSCGNNARHIHHIKPVCEGGADEANNLKMLCQACHIKLHSANNDFSRWGKMGGKATARSRKSLKNLKQFKGKPELLKLAIDKILENAI